MRTIPLLIAFCLFATAAQADTLYFHAVLSGSNEAVPNHVPATGTAGVTLDTATKTVSYRVEYKDLSGPPKIVHFHGLKRPGMKAPEVIIMRMRADHLASPVIGTKTVTDAQIKELEKGQWYANVHTDKYPNGEIRGWLTAADGKSGS